MKRTKHITSPQHIVLPSRLSTSCFQRSDDRRGPSKHTDGGFPPASKARSPPSQHDLEGFEDGSEIVRCLAIFSIYEVVINPCQIIARKEQYLAMSGQVPNKT